MRFIHKSSLWFIVTCVVSAIVYFKIMNMKDCRTANLPINKNEDATNAPKRGMNTQRPYTTPDDRLNKVPNVGHSYKILWYNPPELFMQHRAAMFSGFSQCKFSNCEMSFNKSDSKVSDAIIFEGREMNVQKIERPLGQVWIFASHDSMFTLIYSRNNFAWKYEPWRHSYNWTMSHDVTNTDIHLPYGIIKRKLFPEKRNYTYIASKKNDSALIVTSNCRTYSNRLEYIDELRKYIPVTVLGKCGTPWSCGKHHKHDNCFDLLNTTYKFYLAFESGLCTQYITEKTFENFNYDIILVVRAGNKTEEPTILPNGTYISAQSFDSAKDLGMYLKKLSESREAYAKMLERKSMYYSYGFKEVYQRAMCNLCERMNFQNQYQKTIPDIEEWVLENNPCNTVGNVPQPFITL